MSDISKINIDKKEYFFKDAAGRVRAEEAATEAENAAKEYTDAQVKALKGAVSADFSTLEKIEDKIEELDSSVDEIDEQIGSTNAKVSQVETTANNALALAQSKNLNKVFETTSAMYTWLANAANKGQLQVGSALYIKEADVPDWWITEVLNAPNADGRYYNIAPLEAEGAGGAAGSTVSVQQTLTSGVKIGSITVDGTSTDLYAPDSVTYNTATTSKDGLMSAQDKTKLDGIATGANKTVVDSALSSTSTNPVQNKVINTALAGKANSSHGNHVPATQTANNAVFLRNDNTWQTVTPANIGAAAASHGTHVSYGTSASALGTSSAGTATTVSRSDHVHALPALTSCTGTLTVAKGGTGATDAATARTNLGLGTAATYAATTSITSGGTGLITSGAVYTGLSGKAPTAHATTALTYGGGTATNYGHVKLSDSYTTSAGAASASVAASSKAVADAYAEINSNLSNLRDVCVYPSFYYAVMETSSYVVALESFMEEKGVNYTIDDVYAVVPIGARKSGSSVLYPAIYDGSYLRCEAVEGAMLYVYIFHSIIE